MELRRVPPAQGDSSVVSFTGPEAQPLCVWGDAWDVWGAGNTLQAWP